MTIRNILVNWNNCVTTKCNLTQILWQQKVKSIRTIEYCYLPFPVYLGLLKKGICYSYINYTWSVNYLKISSCIITSFFGDINVHTNTNYKQQYKFTMQPMLCFRERRKRTVWLFHVDACYCTKKLKIPSF